MDEGLEDCLLSSLIMEEVVTQVHPMFHDQFLESCFNISIHFICHKTYL